MSWFRFKSLSWISLKVLLRGFATIFCISPLCGFVCLSCCSHCVVFCHVAILVLTTFQYVCSEMLKWRETCVLNVHKRLGSSLGIPFWYKKHPSNNRPLDFPKNGDFPLGETTKVKSRWESVDDSGRPCQAGASGMLDVAASSGGTLW